MKRVNKVVMGTFAAVSLAMLPFELGPNLSLDVAAAYAKGGNGGGNGGGHGGGNGKGGGSGGSKGSSASSSSHGKSGSAKGSGKASGNHVARASVGKVSIAGAKKSEHSTKTTKALPSAKSSKALPSAKSSKGLPSAKSSKAIASANGLKSKFVRVALPDSGQIPNAKPQNFHAKLAALNSLNRNYHAYLNSKSPRFAAIAEFVKASAEYELAQDAVTKANGDLATAQIEFAAAVDAAAIQPYDYNVSVYQNATVESLSARLEALRAEEVSIGQFTELDVEIASLEGLLRGAEAKAVVDNQVELEKTQLEAEALAVGTDENTLRQALLDMANENRVAQYGNDYVDANMMEWAKDVLGVDEAFGKIDQVKEALSTTDTE